MTTFNKFLNYNFLFPFEINKYWKMSEGVSENEFLKGDQIIAWQVTVEFGLIQFICKRVAGLSK